MGSSGGGMSQAEIYEIQKKAREDAEKEIAQKQAKAAEGAQSAANAGTGENIGGEGTSGAGALGGKKKKGSTLAGEGDAVFSPAASKLGE